MIEILGGVSGSSEFDASKRLKDLILKEWPQVESSAGYDIAIFPNIKCYGEPVEDVDLLVAAYLNPELEVEVDEIGRVKVESFCLAIEVKDKQPDQVEFVGNTVYVTYRGKKESVSEQSKKQVFAVKNYLERCSAEAKPYVTNLIWLTKVPCSAIPAKGPHNILGGDSCWLDIVRRVASLSPNRGPKRTMLSACGKAREMMTDVRRVFGTRLQATRLDRERVEKICRQAIRTADYWNKLGTQLLVFRGRGGAGKTVHLLRVAHHLYEVQGARVLVLTYNNALVSDIRRLFAIIGLKNTPASPRVAIRTVHSYMGALLTCLGVKDVHMADAAFFSNYANLLGKALAVVKTERGRRLFEGVPEVSGWDYVLVDEAQDWLPEERDLLLALFSSRCLVLADGIDQRVRNTPPVDWLERAEKRQIVSLTKLLRLKAGLFEFVTQFADRLGVRDWEVAPNTDAPGGRVIVLEGDYASYWSLHAKLLQENLEDGNRNVDMLFCTPSRPSMRGAASPTGVNFAAELRSRGYQVWDGTDAREKKTYPTELDELRIVNYESCRGLEGWTVVCLGFDEFYDHKVMSLRPPPDESRQIFYDPDEWVRDAAARWMLIPVTRAIDTLVLHVSSKRSFIGELLATMERERTDIIEWIRT